MQTLSKNRFQVLTIVKRKRIYRDYMAQQNRCAVKYDQEDDEPFMHIKSTYEKCHLRDKYKYNVCIYTYTQAYGPIILGEGN